MDNLRKKKRKVLVLFLVCAMVCSLMPGGFARPQKAAAATTALYITDTIGGTSTSVDITTDQNGTGWSWNAESETLTLSGFNGERIESAGDLNIVLSGSNTITLPATQEGNYTYGIKSGTNLTITDDTTNAGDVVDELTITQTAFSAESVTTSCYYYGLYAGNNSNVNITGGNISIDIREDSNSVDPGRTMQVTGIYATGRTTISNSASLDIKIEGQHMQGRGVYNYLYAETTAPINISVAGCSTENNQYATDGLCAGKLYEGTGDITLTAATGWANDGRLEVQAGAGTITFNGAIRIGGDNDMGNSANLNIASNKKFTEPTDKTGFAYYTGTDTSDSGYILCDEDGSKVTSAKLETVEDNPLTFADNPGLDMSGLKVGQSYRGKYFHGLVSGGTKDYTYSVDSENPLPAGLLLSSSAYIYGTPTEACEEGTARIIVKDSSKPQQDAYIDVAYDAVEEAPKNISVGETKFTADQNNSGTGWTYNASTKTLELNNYNGAGIESEDDLTVVLSDSNTITLPSEREDYYAYGIKSGNNLTITDDTTNAGDVVDELTITQTAFSADSITNSCYYYGLYAGNNSNVEITGGNISIDIREDSNSGDPGRTMQVTGIYATGKTTVSNSARLDINIEGQHMQGRGVFNYLYAQTTAPISINVDGCPTENYQYATDGLCAGKLYEETGDITLTAVTGWANDGRLEVQDSAGTINFNGAIRIGTSNSDMNNSYNLNIASNKRFTEPEEKTGIAYYTGTDTSDYGYVLCDEDGNKVTSARLETVENNPLTFADNPGLDMSGLKVGNLYSGKYFHGLVSGGTKNYTYSVDPKYPLPAGLEVKANSGATVYAYIYGTPTEACEAGTARIIVKDSSKPQQDAYIDVAYEAVTVSTPVTGVSLDKDELILNYGEEDSLKYTISPNNATIKTVTWASSDDSIVRVDEGTVKGVGIGKATVTVTTTQGNFKYTCDVYVKGSKPDASIDFVSEKLTRLTPGASYTVSGSGIADKSFTAESSTYSIKSEWIGKTINLVKTNTESKCNSDAQQIDIPERPNAPTTAIAVDESFYEAGDGKISGLSYNMEYRNAEETEWISVSGTTVTNLETGTYEIRTKATSSSFASHAALLSVGTKDFDFVDYEQFDIPEGSANTEVTEIDLSSGVSGGKKPYTFSIVSGPDWIAVSSEGKLSGTRPSEEGEASTAVIRAKDANESSKQITISVGKITHAHDYVVRTISDDTLMTPADCTHDAVYYLSCTCGKISTKNAFVVSNTALGHRTSHDEIINLTPATTSAAGSYDKVSVCDDCRAEINSTKVEIPKIETVSLSKTKLTYTGSGQVPTLTVKDAKGNKLEEGTDYTVSGLVKKTNVGKYTVKVTFNGNYSGTKSLNFTIVPKTPASATATLTAKYGATAGYDDVKFSWVKSTGATGYKVSYKKSSASAYSTLGYTTGTYYYKKNLADGVKYTFKVEPYYQDSNGEKHYSITPKTANVYTLKKLSAPTLSRKGSKVKVKWTNISGETGYQISKSTSKTKTNIVSTYATTSGTYKLISATKSKTYYYKVRAYKTVDGKKIYGPWSSVKAFKR